MPTKVFFKYTNFFLTVLKYKISLFKINTLQNRCPSFGRSRKTVQFETQTKKSYSSWYVCYHSILYHLNPLEANWDKSLTPCSVYPIILICLTKIVRFYLFGTYYIQYTYDGYCNTLWPIWMLYDNIINNSAKIWRK